MTVTRIQLSQTYVQDEHQRMQQALASAVDSGGTSVRTIFAGTYALQSSTSTTWNPFFVAYGGTNYQAGWVADQAGSVIAVSVYDYFTANNQQYGVSINSNPPNVIITRGTTPKSSPSYPVGRINFNQGDLVQLWARNSTTASTSFAASAHLTVSVGA